MMLAAKSAFQASTFGERFRSTNWEDLDFSPPFKAPGVSPSHGFVIGLSQGRVAAIGGHLATTLENVPKHMPKTSGNRFFASLPLPNHVFI